MIFWRKGFWVIFASFSVMHLTEDLIWAVLARYTSVSMFILVGGILFWSFITAIILNNTPLKKFISKGR